MSSFLSMWIPNGTAENLHIEKSSDPALDSEVIRIVRGWQFRPGMKRRPGGAGSMHHGSHGRGRSLEAAERRRFLAKTLRRKENQEQDRLNRGCAFG
jgi:hypothetical protein